MDHLRSGVRDQPDQHGKTISAKKYKISWVWWWAPATREAEAGESLKSGRRRLHGAKIALLHSSLDVRARLSLSQKKGGVSTSPLIKSGWVCG